MYLEERFFLICEATANFLVAFDSEYCISVYSKSSDWRIVIKGNMLSFCDFSTNYYCIIND